MKTRICFEMKHNWLKFIFLVICFVLPYFSGSQENYQFEVVPIAAEKIEINGQLSQGRVSDIVEDERGLIWIGTLDGLNRYDGHKVKVFRHQAGDSTSLDNNQIVRVLKTREGFLWVLTKTGINKFDPYLEISEQQKFPEQFNKVYKIHDIILDKVQNLWIARSDGLYVLKNDSDHIMKIELDAYFTNARKLEVDHLNNIWVGSDKPYLLKYNHHLKEVTTYEYPLSANKTGKYLVFDIHQDKEYNIWVAYFNTQLISENFIPNVSLLEKGSSSLRLFDEYVPMLISKNHHTFLTTIRRFESRENELWISGMSNGLAYIDHKKKKFTYLPEYREFFWHREIDKNVVYFDSNNDLWLGTNGDGAFILPEKEELFRKVNKDLYPEFEIMSVRSFLEFGNKIFIGGYSGLVTMDKKSKKMDKLPIDHVVYCMEVFPGDSNYILIGSEGNGLLKYNPSNNHFKPLSREWTQIKGFERPWMWIFDIYNDGDSVYWCGAKQGILKYTVATEGVKLFQDNENNDFKYGSILSIYRDFSGRLFAGSDEYGLLEFNEADQKFQRFKYRKNPDFSFHSYRVNHINQTQDSVLWISTDKGLLSIGDSHIRTISKKDGLLNDYVYVSIADDDGNLWLSTNDGVFKYDMNINTITSFSIYDGLQAQEFNTAAHFRSKDGIIYLGGVNGFNYFDPKKIYHQKREIPMEVIGFYINNQEINLDRESIKNQYYKIPADIEYFKLEFAALMYHANSKFRYKYRVKELHNRWIDLGYKNEIGFHGLEHGKYNLEVLVADNHGNWNSKPLIVHLDVQSYFWETKLFRYGSIILFVLFVFVVLNYRYILLKKQKFEIEKTVQERTMELSVVNEELIKANETKDKFFNIISHDIKNPLAAAQSISEDLIENERSYTGEEKSVLLGIIGRSMIHLQALLENLRSWSKLQSKEIRPEFEFCEVKILIQSNIRLIAASLIRKRIELNEIVGDNLFVYADYKMLDTILRNLISNAVKFSYTDSVINISAQRKENFVEIQIEDNGIGMTEEQVGNLFIPGLTQSLPGTEDERGTGFGLLMVHEFVKLNNGRINVISVPDHGTRFIVTFPAKTPKAVSVSESNNKTAFET